ncbi:MAG: septal ring lytic transglycosylase RlpA family protein [Rhodospirillaceae bacterium]
MMRSIRHRSWRRAAVMAAVLILAALTVWLLAPPTAGAYREGHEARRTETGLASFYGRAFDGKKTASGEHFDSDELTAAHPSYPLGTRVRVTNLEKGGSVVVRITDRGPAPKYRRQGVIIDLSRAAATKLNMRKDGRARVRLQVLEWGEDPKKETRSGEAAASTG